VKAMLETVGFRKVRVASRNALPRAVAGSIRQTIERRQLFMINRFVFQPLGPPSTGPSGVARPSDSPVRRTAVARLSYPDARDMPKAAKILAALKRDGRLQIRQRGSHRRLVKGPLKRTWSFHDGMELGSVQMTQVAKQFGYTLEALRRLL
jgi:predicted RNA binding protein YcfA (HicA-like mRNA interferase family)